MGSGYLASLAIEALTTCSAPIAAKRLSALALQLHLHACSNFQVANLLSMRIRFGTTMHWTNQESDQLRGTSFRMPHSVSGCSNGPKK